MDGHDVTEVERLIAVLSHDLREPLRAINGFGELLEREAGEGLSERGHEFLSLMRQAGRRMEDLLDGLSEYGQAGRAVEPADGVDLDAMLQTLLQRRQEDIEARGARVTHDPLPVVTADPTGVQKLLDQLLDNALKFNDTAEPHVHVGASERPQGFELTVVDDGIGVPEIERDRVFEMYRRLHPRDVYPGHGIGLAVCKRIVQRHGGRIWIEDGPAGGSAVHVVIG
jgi:signal transduction histidine kinase